jgi:argininosuccinate lyase
MTGTGQPEPPEGYLGTTARITSGPAAELVEAGYALETADAPLLHRGLTLADLAHLVELTECGALTRADAAPVCAVLLEWLDAPAAGFPYDPVYGDAYNSRERELERALGPAAGRLHLGRTRREAGRIAIRLVLRDRLLGLHTDVAAFAEALARQAARHAGTLWADHTYLQPAQPSTFGHYLGGFAEQALRHLDRIAAAYGRADVSPAGAGGAGGTRLPVDRARLAARLGFGSAGPHTRDVMWSADTLADAVTAAVQATQTIAQLASDLEIFASPAFGYVTLDASLCRASVLMPQKRNPYALPVLRGGAGTLVGRLTGLLATGLTPSARTDNWLYAYGEVAGALDLAGRLVRLGRAVVAGLTVDAGALAGQAASHFTAAADLAEDLSLRFGLDYRTAYRVVGRAVADALSRGRTELAVPGVRAAAEQITGAPLPITADLLSAATDPLLAVLARDGLGGASPRRVRQHAQAVGRRVAGARRWNSARRDRIASAEADLITAAKAVASGQPPSPVLSRLPVDERDQAAGLAATASTATAIPAGGYFARYIRRFGVTGRRLLRHDAHAHPGRRRRGPRLIRIRRPPAAAPDRPAHRGPGRPPGACPPHRPERRDPGRPAGQPPVHRRGRDRHPARRFWGPGRRRARGGGGAAGTRHRGVRGPAAGNRAHPPGLP